MLAGVFEGRRVRSGLKQRLDVIGEAGGSERRNLEYVGDDGLHKWLNDEA